MVLFLHQPQGVNIMDYETEKRHLLGRNLDIYQQIEYLVKQLAITARTSLTMDGATVTTKRPGDCTGKTLGQSIPNFLKIFHDPKPADLQSDTGKVKIQFSQSILLEDAEYARITDKLKDISKERNWLVHESLLVYNSNPHQWRKRIDQQYSDARVLLLELSEHCKSLDSLTQDTKQLFEQVLNTTLDEIVSQRSKT